MIHVYIKDYCPFCHAATDLLDSIKASYETTDVSNKPELFEEIKQKSGMNTVPQIFVNDKCLGGFSEINVLHQEGKLLNMLK